MWYGSGTIAVTADGNNATGTGTQFLGNVRVGDGIAIQGSASLHEVTGVTSNTQLTFAPPYAGPAGSGKAYRVAPVLGYDKDLSDAFNALRLQFGERLSSLQPWAYANTAQAARDELFLKSASTRNVGLAAGDVLERGAFGLGSPDLPLSPTANVIPTGFYGVPQTAEAVPPAWVGGNMVHTRRIALNRGVSGQLLMEYSGRGFLRGQISDTWTDWFEIITSNSLRGLPISSDLSPSADNSVSYGRANRRPSQLFAATATIGTSDAREKTPIRPLTDAEYAAGLQLAREIGAYRWLEAVERKGDDARWHTGQTVQRAMEIFRQHGLDPFSYGAICYDEWERETIDHPAEYEQLDIPAEYDEDGIEQAPARIAQGRLIKDAWTEVIQDAGDRYSWRDSELFWLICAAQQKQQDEITARLEALEGSAG